MTQKSLSNWLKAVLAGIAACGAILYACLIPMFGKDLVHANPELSYYYAPWLAVIWISAIPCYLVLYFGWKITVEIGRDNSFSMDNSRYLKYIAVLALADSGYFFLANLALLILNMNHPSVLLGSLFLEFAGVAVAVAAAVLSHLVQKAAKIQEENEFTI